MQNGKLFQGDIYSNIVISAPWLTQKDAWEAAELAGIAEDIRKMPMGMNTMISEGSRRNFRRTEAEIDDRPGYCTKTQASYA